MEIRQGVARAEARAGGLPYARSVGIRQGRLETSDPRRSAFAETESPHPVWQRITMAPDASSSSSTAGVSPMLRRTVSLGFVIAATLTLTGCFVASLHVPKGTGPVADRRLVGSWQGIDDGDHNPTSDDVVLTFRMTTSAKPLRLTWSESKKRLSYDVYTQKSGRDMGFAARSEDPAFLPEKHDR